MQGFECWKLTDSKQYIPFQSAKQYNENMFPVLSLGVWHLALSCQFLDFSIKIVSQNTNWINEIQNLMVSSLKRCQEERLTTGLAPRSIWLELGYCHPFINTSICSDGERSGFSVSESSELHKSFGTHRYVRIFPLLSYIYRQFPET